MNEPQMQLSVVLVCLIAFVVVMVLLGFLAGVIRLIENAFPHRKSDEEVVREVLQQAVESAIPGARVSAFTEISPG